MDGLVYKSTGSWYTVKDEKGCFWNARMKGIFKLDDITSTNPLAVGDKVRFEIENDAEHSAMITWIYERGNYITRQSQKIKSQQHIVAANLDQTMVIATIREPRTSQGFIDRFLVTSEMYHLPAIVLFNKIDLYQAKDIEKLQKMEEIYDKAGYMVAAMSLLGRDAPEQVPDLLKDKITLISGHSGVGKSTFINRLILDVNIRTQNISGWSSKGKHTTTFAEMYDLPAGGKIIDTPGMKEFGVIGVDKQELSGYFPEMRKQLVNCQFNNCLHINEPGCAIKEAVSKGEIDENRYISYVNILTSLEEQDW